MKSFQSPDRRIHGMDMQKKIFGLLLGKKKVYFEKTQNQQKMIEISKELDRSYVI